MAQPKTQSQSATQRENKAQSAMLAVVANQSPSDAAAQQPMSPAEDAYNAVEAALDTIGEESRPLVLRSHVRRERIAEDIREVDNLLADALGRESLLDQAYEAAKKSLASHKADLEAELALLRHGLAGLKNRPEATP